MLNGLYSIRGLNSALGLKVEYVTFINSGLTLSRLLILVMFSVKKSDDVVTVKSLGEKKSIEAIFMLTQFTLFLEDGKSLFNYLMLGLIQS